MTKIALSSTGYNTSTPKHYLIHAAALFVNVTFNATTDIFEADRCLGATVGGTKVTIEQELRTVEVDGVLTKAVGTDLLENANGTIETTVKEVTAENLTIALNGTLRDVLTDEGPTGYKVIETKDSIASTDYITNIGIYGKLSGSTQPVLIIVDNCLNTGGLAIEMKDKGEAGIPLKLEARASVSDAGKIKSPVKIFFPPIDVV